MVEDARQRKVLKSALSQSVPIVDSQINTRTPMAVSRVSRTLSISPTPSKRRKRDPGPSLSDADVAAEEFDPGRLTIYSWNVNGVSPFVQRTITSFFRISEKGDAKKPEVSATPASLRDVLRRFGWPTMLFLQEVKISPEDSATQRAIERAVMPGPKEAAGQPSYRVSFCLPSDKYNARGSGRKVYGVCSIIRQDFFETFVERVREVDWDQEGRFLVCETKAAGPLPKLAIFNIYAVNGTDAPYKCSETGAIVGTRHDRKLQVHKLLQDECGAQNAKGVEVILAGDLNVARATIDGHPNLRTHPKQHCLNRADFEARFLSRNDGSFAKGLATSNNDGGLGFIDTFRHLHPEKRAYTYYPRGQPFGTSCDRVDMILISATLGNMLIAAGMKETPADRGPSDHVPLYAQLNLRNSSDASQS